MSAAPRSSTRTSTAWSTPPVTSPTSCPFGDDLVAQCRIEEDGSPTPLDEPAAHVAPGSGARHLILSADERSAYLMTEFTGMAIRFDRNPFTGMLEVAESVKAYDTTRGLTHSAFGADQAGHLAWGRRPAPHARRPLPRVLRTDRVDARCGRPRRGRTADPGGRSHRHRGAAARVQCHAGRRGSSWSARAPATPPCTRSLTTARSPSSIASPRALAPTGCASPERRCPQAPRCPTDAGARRPLVWPDDRPGHATTEAILAASVARIGGATREGQHRMARAVASALADGEHLLIQAGTARASRSVTSHRRSHTCTRTPVSASSSPRPRLPCRPSSPTPTSRRPWRPRSR